MKIQRLIVNKVRQFLGFRNDHTKPTFPTHDQHPVFRQFTCSATPVPGFIVNFIGQRTDPKFLARSSAGFNADYPPVSEESFEWIAVLEAVLEAHDVFTMFELGAGYGRWLTTAVLAAKQKDPTLRFHLTAVEAEPTHFKYLKQHMIDNELDPRDYELIEAAVTATGEPVQFVIGHPEEWYGQQVMAKGSTAQDLGIENKYPKAEIIRVRGVSLDSLLDALAFVDLIDMDIQGAESEVIQSSIDAMTKKVRRLYVETHSRKIHITIEKLLIKAGWILKEAHGWKKRDVLPAGPDMTEFGIVNFQGDCQYWLNDRAERST